MLLARNCEGHDNLSEANMNSTCGSSNAAEAASTKLHKRATRLPTSNNIQLHMRMMAFAITSTKTLVNKSHILPYLIR